MLTKDVILLTFGLLIIQSCVVGTSATSNHGKTVRFVGEAVGTSSNDCQGDKDKYCGIHKKHSMCIYCGTDNAKCKKVVDRGISSKDEKDKIVDYHNKLRRKVAKGKEKKGVGGSQPTATDMHELKWNEELAKVAQRWVDQCPPKFGHDDERGTVDFPSVGQNAAMRAQSKGPYKDRNYEKMINGWYDEVKHFPSSNVDKFSNKGATGVTGHYTQVVWGNTTEVGCVLFISRMHHFTDSSLFATMALLAM